MYLIDHVRSRCESLANEIAVVSTIFTFRSGRCPIPAHRASFQSSFTPSGILSAVIRPSGERSQTPVNRAETINNALNLSESMTGGKPACLKSVHQRTQTAIHACVMAMFSDWLRLNSRIVKNAYARLKEMTRQCTVNS